VTDLLVSRRDLNFLLYDWLGVDSLVRFPRFADHNRETFDAVIDTCQRIAVDLFEPHYRKNDQIEPYFDGQKVHLNPEVSTALKAFVQAGLMAGAKGPEHGGMNLPAVVERAALAYFMAANPSTAGYPLLAMGNANTLLAHGTAAQVTTFAKPIFEGRSFGTMCLSEPHAGSSLSDITTRAEFECDSPLGPQYRLTGRKMWISAGDHELTENIVHLVLAKVPDESGRLIAGSRGISLFIVPKYLPSATEGRGERNDVALAGLNHKMGYRGTTNCLLNFGEGTAFRPQGRPGAIGWRVGELHRGLSCMFHMMNEARIGVGMGATMLGYTGYLHALDYARNRPQGRPVDASGKNADTPQVPIIGHDDVKRMLLAQKSYVEGALALTLYCSILLDEQNDSPDAATREQAGLLLEVLTPIAKSWPSQWCLAANDLAIQVHGGYGYTRDYKVEQFYRDNRLNPIHEGTHGIQALDLLGRKVVMKQGLPLQILLARIGQSVQTASSTPGLQAHAASLNAIATRLGMVTMSLWATRDPNRALVNATDYLEAFGHIVLAWIWLQQACAVQPLSGDFRAGKLAACRYFFEWELPKANVKLDLLESGNGLLRDMQEAWF
jgi:alkylation response protein AidB-like acyl-CoA dehydrogenase